MASTPTPLNLNEQHQLHHVHEDSGDPAPVGHSVEDPDFDELRTAAAELMASTTQCLDSDDDDEQEQMTSRTR
ncbi:TPA: hypothetical protein ACH3X1_016398 [Trebouxia sp. C0004]